MEPKNLGFSAGLALLILYVAAPDAARELGAVSTSDTIVLSGLLWSALTAVIAPFAAVGKAGLKRFTTWIEGKTDAP